MWETHLLSVEVGEEEFLYQMIHDQRGEFVRLSKIELFSARNEVFVKHLTVPFLIFICYHAATRTEQTRPIYFHFEGILCGGFLWV